MRVFNRPGRGERNVERRLGRYLDDRFTLVHRVRLPNRKNVVDAVLVGPQGVTVLACVHDEGRVRGLGDNWYLWNPKLKDFVKAGYSPIKQAQGDRAAIEAFLAGRQMGSVIPVDCAVVVPRSDQVEFMQAPMPILSATKIAEFAAGLARQRELIEWTQADDMLKSLGVPPSGQPWRMLDQAGGKLAARSRRPAKLRRWQIVFLVVMAVADLLVLLGGLAVVLLVR